MDPDCDPCGGTGKVDDEECRPCCGTGYDVARRLDAYRAALLNEVEQNAFKGSWLDGDGWHIEELIYHCFKLALAHREGNAAAVLHYAADVGNHAWFLADVHEALTMDPLPLVKGAIEYSEEGLDAPPEELARLKALAKELAEGFAP